MEPNSESGVRYRQPPRPPVRPFPNPTPQREGLVKRLPTWSSRRAIPHTVPDMGPEAPQIYTERSPDISIAQASSGTFGKIVASEEPFGNVSYPFHYDIPPPIPYTNCPKQYISGNVTRKLPIAKGPVKTSVGAPHSTMSSSIPSSVPHSNSITAAPARYAPPLPPPPSRSAIPPASQQIARQAPPPPPGPPPTSRPAPPPPSSRPVSTAAVSSDNPGPPIRRTRRPPAGARPPFTQPGHAAHPPPNIRAPPPPPTNPAVFQVPPEHPLFSAQTVPSNPDVERANWFRNKLISDLQNAAANDQDLYATMHHTLSHLDGLLGQLSLSQTDDEYTAILSALEQVYESIQNW